ncbi:hypothetical protein MferCBS31731_006941 [Microsporum ferrugineum]
MIPLFLGSYVDIYSGEKSGVDLGLDGGYSGSDHLLDPGIDLDHLLVQLGVLVVHDLRAPAGGHKDGLDPAGQRGREDVRDLEADEEREGDDERRVLPFAVVRRVGEEQIQVREKGARIRDEEATEREDRPDQAVLQVATGENIDWTYIYEGVKAAVLDHFPRVPGRGNVRLAVQGDVAEGIAVEELGQPFQEADETSQDAKDGVANGASDAPVLHRLAPGDRAQVPQELDDRDNQAPEADGAEAVGQRPPARPPRCAPGQTVRGEVPGAVHAGDGGVDGVFEPLGDPVHGKSDKDDQPDHLAAAAAQVAVAGRVVAGRLELIVDGDQGDRVVGPERGCDQTANETDHVDMAVPLADVHGGPEHQGRERNPADPGPEAKGEEEAKDEEDDARAPIVPPQVEDGRPDGPADVEDARHPDKLLGEEAREPDVGVPEDDGDDEHEDEEDDRARVERKGVRAVVDAAALDAPRRRIALERDARHHDEAGAEEEEL